MPPDPDEMAPQLRDLTTIWSDISDARSPDAAVRAAGLERLASVYFEPCVNYVRNRCHLHEEEAREVVSDFFTGRILSSDKWLSHPQRGSEPGWFRRCLRQTLYQTYLTWREKKRKDHTRSTPTGFTASPEDPYGEPEADWVEDQFRRDLDEAEVRAALEVAKERSPDGFEVWHAVKEAGRDYADLERDLDIREGTLRVRVHRFQSLLAAILQHRFADG